MVLSSSEDKLSSCSDEGEMEMVEERVSESDSVHDISDYLYLVDAHYYDEVEKSVYKATRIVEEGE